MKRKEQLTIKRLVGLCKEIPDGRRRSGNWRHALADVLVICLLGIICGHETWDEIYDYAKAKRLFLWQFIELRNGIPSPSTLRRVMGMIKPEALEEVYRAWVKPYIGTCLGKQINVDGKTIRGASNMGEENIHMVSAWVAEDKISMAQVKTQEKSNEIKAIPDLLTALDIRGGLVSGDAMACQRAIVDQIIGQKAHYLLAVKRNQPTLFEEMQLYFDWAVTDPVEKRFLQEYVCTEQEHGRITKWKVQACDAGWFQSKADWCMLHTFVRVVRICTRNGKTSRESAFFISDLQAEAKLFHKWVRNHWGIENRLHWTLDVSFHEDASLMHEPHAVQNISLLRKFALAAILSDSSCKASVNRKRKMAALDDRFALALLASF